MLAFQFHEPWQNLLLSGYLQEKPDLDHIKLRKVRRRKKKIQSKRVVGRLLTPKINSWNYQKCISSKS